jgi:hypothetical protein
MSRDLSIARLLQTALGAGVGVGAGYLADQMLQPTEDEVAKYLNVRPSQMIDSAPITIGLGALAGGALAYKMRGGRIARPVRATSNPEFHQLTLDDALLDSLLK